MAALFEVIGGDIEREAVRDEQRGHHFERCAGIGKVLYQAVYAGAAADLHGPGLEGATTWRGSVFIHGNNLTQSFKRFVKRQCLPDRETKFLPNFQWPIIEMETIQRGFSAYGPA